MRREVAEFDLEKIIGGIKISRQTETSGKVYYNGQEYPFDDYDGIVAVAQECVNSGNYSDDDLFNAFKAAGLI